ncbi:MAG: beta-lactamase family protein [Anaerolineaceae bacterium]|nr:beta-lactamase family protein [Anaerolineaceae bacterium]
MLAVCSKTPGVFAAQPTLTTADFTAVDAYIAAQMKAARIPGVALAVVQGEEIIYLKGYGVADPSGRPVTPQTPFMLASTVKPMTALAVMQLVEAGQIDLDAPVQQYLPWFRVGNISDAAHITIRHLLNHTSGLPTASGDEVPPSTDMGADALENRVRRLNAVQLNRPVGERFEYSSANYDILGLIVQTVSGQSYETYIQEHIFKPLEMQRTFTSLAEAEPHGLAIGYRSWFGFPIPFDGPHPRAYAPSGWAVSSTAEDLAHLAIAQLNEGRYGDTAVLSADGIAAMYQPTVQSYSPTQYSSLGWNISPIADVQTIGAGGDAANFRSRLLLVPQHNLGLVVLMNMNTVDLNAGYFEFYKGILNLLLNQLPPEVQTPHYQLTFIPLLVILLVTLVIVVAMIRAIMKLRRWPLMPERRAHNWRATFQQTGPHLVLHLAWTALLLIGFPLIAGRSLFFLILYIPDLGYTLLASAALALVWSLYRMVWVRRLQ